MNLWHPIGVLISVLIVWWSIQDERLLDVDPDELLRKTIRGRGANFYLTLQTALGRLMRYQASRLAEIQDPDERQAALERAVLAMPGKERVLQRVRWEIRFRIAAFAVFAAILLYDWLVGLA